MWFLLLTGCIANRCDEVDALPEASIAAIGDSILAWNAKRCRSVVDHTSLELGARIDNRAVNGARLRFGSNPIPEQLEGSDADLVMITGGGNDLNGADVCDATNASETLDTLVTADGSEGVMAELVTDLESEGRTVLLLGYYGVKEAGWYGLGKCGEEVSILKRRYEVLAERHPAAHYVDMEETVQSNDGGSYAFDAVHPSPKGAERLGAVLADVIADLPVGEP